MNPHDLLVLLKLIAVGRHENWTYNSLAVGLAISPSQVHSAIKRTLHSGLAVKIGDKVFANTSNLNEFIVHASSYVFPPKLGSLVRGMPTVHGAPPISDLITADGEPLPVWPDPKGTVRGLSFSPLCKSVPVAANNDKKLYELLVLVDTIRGGRAREREIAKKELKKVLDKYD